MDVASMSDNEFLKLVIKRFKDIESIHNKEDLVSELETIIKKERINQVVLAKEFFGKWYLTDKRMAYGGGDCIIFVKNAELNYANRIVLLEARMDSSDEPRETHWPVPYLKEAYANGLLKELNEGQVRSLFRKRADRVLKKTLSAIQSFH